VRYEGIVVIDWKGKVIDIGGVIANVPFQVFAAL
jgi:hypothetical protein